MLLYMLSVVCLVPVTQALVCGMDGNCVCTMHMMRCKGFPGNLPVGEKQGVHLLVDMEFNYNPSLDYGDMLSGFQSVRLVNAPAIACEDPHLVIYLRECVSTKLPRTSPFPSPRDTTHDGWC